MKQPPSATLRMETLNVRSLSGRLGGVLDLANLHALHVMCFQETRVHQDSWSVVCIAAKKSGWDVYPGKQDTDSSGAVVGGTLILSKWPAQPVQVPDTVQCRVMAVKLYRPSQRPLLLVNVYLKSGIRTVAGHCLNSVFISPSMRAVASLR